MSSMDATGHGEASKEMHETMMKGMQDMQALPMSSDPDHDFAVMMKHHHQMGMKMAEIELKHGKNPEMKTMAKETIKSQGKETQQLEAWLGKHNKSADKAAE